MDSRTLEDQKTIAQERINQYEKLRLDRLIILVEEKIFPPASIPLPEFLDLSTDVCDLCSKVSHGIGEAFDFLEQHVTSGEISQPAWHTFDSASHAPDAQVNAKMLCKEYGKKQWAALHQVLEERNQLKAEIIKNDFKNFYCCGATVDEAAISAKACQFEILHIYNGLCVEYGEVHRRLDHYLNAAEAGDFADPPLFLDLSYNQVSEYGNELLAECQQILINKDKPDLVAMAPSLNLKYSWQLLSSFANRTQLNLAAAVEDIKEEPSPTSGFGLFDHAADDTIGTSSHQPQQSYRPEW